jgi:protein-S-isoprenylcysteine O-methyltransferase Ste14
MITKLIIIYLFSVLYGLFELFSGILHKQKSKVVNSGDRMSIFVLIISISFGYAFAFWVASTKTGRIYHWNTFLIAGGLIALSGLVIRISSILTLKKHFTYTITEVEHHELIEKGLYRFIRHPGYLGQLIIFFGISLALSNWLSILLMMIPVISGYIYRIHTEEQFMIKQFGDTYLSYRGKAKRLIPRIY